MGEVTVGEMVRTLQSFKEDVRDDLRAINNRLDNMNMVHVDVYAADRTADQERHRAMADRLAALEKSQSADRKVTDDLRFFNAKIVGACALAVTAAGFAGYLIH